MGPLQGLKIIELAGIGPGPFCGMLLADLGADVVVVDRKGRPLPLGGKATADITRRGKRSIALDLKVPQAIETVLRLVEGADGLIEGFRPGVTERLGLGPEQCMERNPRLVYGRMTGWGQTGPLAGAAGHDINYISLSGALYHGGHHDSPPAAPPTLVGDIGGGAMFLALGVVSAILSARSSGQGQVVDAAITDGSALMTALMFTMLHNGRWNHKRQSNVLDGGAFWYDCYQCADGEWISVGALEPQFYAELIERCGLTDEGLQPAQFDIARWPELRQRFERLFRTKTRDEWCAQLEGTDVCFAPVLNLEEATRHPHNRARRTFLEVDGVVQPAPAPRFSATPAELNEPPAEVGAHAAELLAEAGFSERDIEALKSTGAL